jgi:hypothetical protein
MITFIMVSMISSHTVENNGYSIPAESNGTFTLSGPPEFITAHIDSDTVYTPGKEPTPPPPPFE